MKYVTFLLLVILASCASKEEQEERLTAEIKENKFGEADMHSAVQKSIIGIIKIEQVKDTLVLRASLSGLRINSRIGIHIHANGVCEGPDYKSAGDHYNPHEMKHGSQSTPSHHSGDMGNLITDKVGNSDTSFTLKGVTLYEVLGKTIIIHAKTDDFKTQPSGNSGDRIACGLIRPLQ